MNAVKDRRYDRKSRPLRPLSIRLDNCEKLAHLTFHWFESDQRIKDSVKHAGQGIAPSTFHQGGRNRGRCRPCRGHVTGRRNAAARLTGRGIRLKGRAKRTQEGLVGVEVAEEHRGFRREIGDLMAGSSRFECPSRYLGQEILNIGETTYVTCFCIEHVSRLSTIVSVGLRG